MSAYYQKNGLVEHSVTLTPQNGIISSILGVNILILVAMSMSKIHSITRAMVA